MKVLVVDDDIVARMMLMHLVDSCGNHAILEAEDGADAWRQLESGLRPDIVFCDLRMPHLSGLQLLQRVRAGADTAALPFVLVSAASDGATLDEAAALGASGYIVKPFRQEDVRAQFTRLFPALAGAEGLAEAPDEAPDEVARRLGIDHARLRLYLDGLARQLQVAMHEPPAGDEGTQARLNRLREGCKTLGLYGAAAALATVAEARSPAPHDVAAALATAGAAVARQAGRAAHG
ncbi:response regulator [Massilia timonae]|uniref:Response regulator n=1 Tax=Massilia timonae TaxID=47229 RepID=A0A1S2N5V5_9BURK|nr:response regulator [Massilia timonae]OIJ39974.1 response regulator [Massilia timonae]